ncbi:multicopper oxidase domain-containing protein [Nitratidesulfovibrio liaohensis]|uniref:Multicopper oxidase CueO n=1 Tax=Nitratidesulfovibrio liaohensis TaxID=2604158 RepID=A0ABY9R533_9BACT|nr:multicopper oxidase domain-containing protein [Nitratidesulfovibrio liaohensis]WMW66337.1 multicopper oxidase domain-containing protein [Nitratidesulfovibrio liaohensis]
MPQSRRDFLSLTAKCAMLAAGADLGLPMLLHAATPEDSGSTALPVPGKSGLFGLLAPEGGLTLTAAEAPGALPASGAPMLAYRTSHKGMDYLNPILVLNKGQNFEATLVNGLSEPTIVHWHGVDGPWRQAGHPSYAIGPGGSYKYAFPITNRAGTYWYHPHPHALTAKQAYMGLASFFIVRDGEEEAFAKDLDLRLGETDIPLVIQDKRLTPNGQLDYSPSQDDLFMGYLGNIVLANGQRRSTLKTATRLYRFRLLNGSTARIYNLSFVFGGARLPFLLVGNDGGFLPAPQQLDGLFLAPGERAEVLLDLRTLSPGQEVFLQNMPFDPMHNEGGGMMGMMGMGEMAGMGHGSAQAPVAEHGGGHETAPVASAGSHGALGEGDAYPILRLLVEQKVAYDRSLPKSLPDIPKPPTGGTERPITLAMRHMGGWTINGLTFDMDSSPIVVKKRGPEVWRISNSKESMPHPMHLHGYFYRVLERRGSPPQVKSRAVDPRGRLASDLGYKDTVLVWPGETVSVCIDFGTPKYPGEQLFLFHCHNLEHEDQGMMLNVKVV